MASKVMPVWNLTQKLTSFLQRPHFISNVENLTLDLDIHFVSCARTGDGILVNAAQGRGVAERIWLVLPLGLTARQKLICEEVAAEDWHLRNNTFDPRQPVTAQLFGCRLRVRL